MEIAKWYIYVGYTTLVQRLLLNRLLIKLIQFFRLKFLSSGHELWIYNQLIVIDSSPTWDVLKQSWWNVDVLLLQ